MKKKLTLLIISSLAVGLFGCGEQKSIDNNIGNEISSEVVEETKDEYKFDIEKDLTKEIKVEREKIAGEIFDTIYITYTNNSDIEIFGIDVDINVESTHGKVTENKNRNSFKDNLKLIKGQSVILNIPCDEIKKYNIIDITITEHNKETNKYRNIQYNYNTKQYTYGEWK